MRFSSILIAFMISAGLCVGSARAQNGKTVEQGGAAAPTHAQTSHIKVKGMTGDQQLIPKAKRTLTESLQKALREVKERESLQPYRLLAGNGPRRDRGPGSFDDGIYLRQVDGANVCGAIVSYNFSSGENPQLESVTTCTPTNAVRSMRARGKNKMPKRPQVVRVVFQREKKK